MMGWRAATALPEDSSHGAIKSKRTSMHLFLALVLLNNFINPAASYQPLFTAPIVNLTVSLGRDAVFRCLVQHLGGYRVGWVKADTKAIQAIHDHVITHNPRVSISHTDHSTWNLHIHNVREEDRGAYMCQINTDPMLSQLGFLEVVVPPDFVAEETSGDVSVPEGGVVKLTCKASGHPEPRVLWRREDGTGIILRDDAGARATRGFVTVHAYQGEILKLMKISRTEMGAYLCIATNGVPPSVSKRVMVSVNFPPVMQVPNQLVGAPLGTDVTLECILESSPKAIYFWMKGEGEMVIDSTKYNLGSAKISPFEMLLTVTVRNIQKKDLGSYRCLAKNSIGEIESYIRLYEIPGPTEASTHPIDDEVFGEQGGSADKARDDEISNSATGRGRHHLHMTLSPPRLTYNTVSKNGRPLGGTRNCAGISTVATTAIALSLFITLPVFTI